MRYEYTCNDCKHPTVKGKDVACVHEISLPVSQCQAFGASRKCPAEGCPGKVVRILSLDVNFIVRGNTTYKWSPDTAMRTNINGQDIRFQFVDHPHTAPEYQRDLSAFAKSQGVSTRNGMGKAYYSEKHGRVVVDVASNIPDPLGAMERAKRRGDTETTVLTPKQSFKTRKRSKR